MANKNVVRLMILEFLVVFDFIQGRFREKKLLLNCSPTNPSKLSYTIKQVAEQTTRGKSKL